MRSLEDSLQGMEPAERVTEQDLTVLRSLASEKAPWDRTTHLHATASALVLDPSSAQVLLRWHQGQQAWLQVGGHGEAGESDPYEIALREAREETGLPDLAAWPHPDRPEILHAVIVEVAASSSMQSHRHADLRYVLATRAAHLASAEHPDAPLRWMTIERAIERTTEPNVQASLRLLRRELERATPR